MEEQQQVPETSLQQTLVWRHSICRQSSIGITLAWLRQHLSRILMERPTT